MSKYVTLDSINNYLALPSIQPDIFQRQLTVKWLVFTRYLQTSILKVIFCYKIQGYIVLALFCSNGERESNKTMLALVQCHVMEGYTKMYQIGSQ